MLCGMTVSSKHEGESVTLSDSGQIDITALCEGLVVSPGISHHPKVWPLKAAWMWLVKVQE